EKHISIVAALQIGLSIFGILVGITVFTILYFVGDFADDQEAQFILSLIGKIVVVLIVILSIPGIIAGIGLLKRKEWARILTLIISALNLFSFPFGTAVGVYSIWAMAQPEIIELFKKS
ncbi:MAG: hypothetical protein J7L95_00080, partial [Prolixibacteraceae bacterium]|nr:hypothetical protein [Prolixibacteraceae bacterium]